MGDRSVFLALAALGLACCAGPAAAGCTLAKIAELPVTMEGLAPIVPAKINGVDARLVADSGAFFSMLGPASVAKFGLSVGPPPFGLIVRGVNGDVSVGLARAKEFTVLNNTFHNSDFLVGGSGISAGADGLLGGNLLDFADVEYDLANGVIRLFKPQGCEGAALAYWSQGKPFSVLDIDRTSPTSRKINASASVNGVRIRVELDTGSYRSMLTKGAARHAGIDPKGPGVISAGLTGGLGRRPVSTWLAPVKSFKIGDEDVQNTRMRFGEIELDSLDMLLGADFFLSHRLYVANSQHKLYFTYNGGPVFNLDTAEDAPGGGPAPATSPAAAAPAPASGAPGDYSDEPKDADGFARRGAAFAARMEYVRAIADFTRAIELDPKESKRYYDRAHARFMAKQPALAMADLDKAIELKPDDAKALEARASVRLSDKNIAGAQADFDAAARVDPPARLAAALALTGSGAFEDAVAEWDQWIAALPKPYRLQEALNGRCWTRALWGKDLDKALADCDAALKLSPREAAFLDSRGLVHLRLGQLDASIADYDEALRRNPKVAWSLYGRGLAKHRKGLQAEGDADIRSALVLAPRIEDEAKKYGLTP